MSLLLAAADPVSHAVPHALSPNHLFEFTVGGPDVNIPALGIYEGVYRFYITNHLSMTFVSAVLVLLVFFHVANRVKPKGQGLDAYKTRGRLSQLFETMCTFVRDEVVRPNLGDLTDKYIYYIWTVFFFVLFANVLGLVPIGYMLQTATGDTHLSHWGGSATGNLSLNIMLALCSFIGILYVGIRETGFKTFMAHFNPLGWDDPKMLVIGIPLYVLEWMGLLIKCTVLAMRLFGTMMSGHLVIAAFVGLVFMARESSYGLAYGVEISVILLGILLTLLELFICFLQAFIFTFLTVLFISMVAHHHDHGHSEEHALDDEHQMDVDKLLDPSRITPMHSAPA
jgi:F-type H+-transporting ATPase subunit a